jgi:hypothetical protein
MIANIALACLVCAPVSFTMLVMLKDLEGPWDIFGRLRMMLCRYDAEYIPVNFFAKLFDCHWCLGTWVSAVIALAFVALGGLVWWSVFYIWLWCVAFIGLFYRFT